MSKGRCYIKYNNKFVCDFCVDFQDYLIKYCDDKELAIHFNSFNDALKFVKMINIFCPYFMRHVTIV